MLIRGVFSLCRMPGKCSPHGFRFSFYSGGSVGCRWFFHDVATLPTCASFGLEGWVSQTGVLRVEGVAAGGEGRVWNFELAPPLSCRNLSSAEKSLACVVFWCWPTTQTTGSRNGLEDHFSY